MPFAAVTYVDLEGRDPAAGQQLLEERLIPMLKGLSGFGLHACCAPRMERKVLAP
jgi:hypothetical protein